MSDVLKLWFFRDLNDDQRLKLFGLFGLPVDEIGPNHGRQSMALRHITQKLVEMVRDEIAPSPATNVVGMDDEDRTPVPEGFDAAKWQKADEVFHATALVADDSECVKIIYAALEAEGRTDG